MRLKLQLLDERLVQRILSEAFELLVSPGVKVGCDDALDLLKSAGASTHDDAVRIPEGVVRRALNSVPRKFSLYDRQGRAAVRYGWNQVQFDPGSSCLNILDSETQEPRPAIASDLVRMVQVAEMLPQFAAQSTAMVPSDVPVEMADWYRLLLVLWHSDKPVVTGAFSVSTLRTMLELLSAEAGGTAALAKKPRAIFDVCPSPPLNWSEFAAQNLVDLARAGVPAEIISMPMAGATAPVTLAGSVVQHAAETLAGITIHQLAHAGAPVVWGGAPAIFDMSSGNAPMGAIETAMLNMACTQVGRYLGLPTHGYLVATDSKHLDAQAGLESAVSALLGTLAGINMISGAGMLDSLACHSIEKLILDAEAIASSQRLVEGIQPRADGLAVQTFQNLGDAGEFLKLEETRLLFRKEQHFPSAVIERGGDFHSPDLLTRARARTQELVGSYKTPMLKPSVAAALLAVAHRKAESTALDHLPGIDQPEPVLV